MPNKLKNRANSPKRREARNIMGLLEESGKIFIDGKEVRKMKSISALFVTLFLTGILGLTAPVMAYNLVYLRLTGTILPVEEEFQGGLHDTINMSINETTRIFQLAKVKNLQANGYGREALRHVVPARVSFVGDEDLIHHLLKPDMVGKPCTITGFLYPTSRVFFITETNLATPPE